MAYGNQVDLLEPINLVEHLDKMELYLGQVCQIAGISKMQLDYWTNKAQIPTKGKKQRIYDMDALETVMLIKQAKDKGLNLGAAIEAARRFREQKRESLVALTRLERLAQALGRGSSGATASRRCRRRARRRRRSSAAARPRGASARPSCSHAFHGTGPSSGAQRADRVGEQAERGSEERALEAAGLVLDAARCSSSYGDAAGRRREERDAVPLRDHALGGRPLVGEQRTEPARLPRLRCERRRRLAEPDELRVGVRQARARDPAFVDERVQVARSPRPRAARARPPRLGDEREPSSASSANERTWRRRMDDDLLPLERGVEVRDDAHLPAGRDARSVSGGVRSSRPAQNGQRLELLRRRRLELGHADAGPPRAARRDDGQAAR